MSYGDDPRLRLQRATRFFARLHSFDLECPHCGDVYTVRTGAQRRDRKRHTNWDPWTARLTCSNDQCGRTYVLGICAWPVAAIPKVASAPPRDQVPGPRQLAQLRREGGGWWMSEEDRIKRASPPETNLTTEMDRPEEEDDE